MASNKSSSKKLKEILDAFRSSFKSRRSYRRDPATSYKSCNSTDNFSSRQKHSDNSSSVLRSDTSASAVSTNSISRDLFNLSQSSSEGNLPDKKHSYRKEDGKDVISKSPETEANVKEFEEKPKSKQLDVVQKPTEKKSNPKQLSVTLKSPEREPNVQQLGVTPNSSKEDLIVKQLNGYVGFANLPNQIYWKAVKKGFEFTLMVVGQSGLGKSTLINSMFLTDIYNSATYPGPTQRSKKTVSVEATKIMLKESGVNLALTVIDTPGFGDAINNANSWAPIVEYIDSKNEDYLISETRINRTNISDERVHCCLYFIQPTGHSLKSLDIEFMKRLHDKVNIVPIIAKADTLTQEECDLFKKQIMQQIAENNINIYEFPDISEEDEDYHLNKSLRDRVPFAVIGSNTLIEINGKKVRGRKYPWGVVDIENTEQCDFMALRKMVVCTHMQDLIDVTHSVRYENYRSRQLLSSSDNDGKYPCNNLVEMNNAKLEHDLKIQKMKCEMQQIFEAKVREKLLNFEHRQAEMTRKYEAAKRILEQQGRDIEVKWKQFILDKDAWENEKRGEASD